MENAVLGPVESVPAVPSWKTAVARYQKPVLRSCVGQILSARVPGAAVIMSAVFGIPTRLMLPLGMVAMAATAGVWLFYVQHQFEGICWQRGQRRSHAVAARKGGLFYTLPKAVQRFCGNIGFHHIHRFGPAIPNENREKCQQAAILFQPVESVTRLAGLMKSFAFRLRDEQRRRLASYSRLPKFRRMSATQPVNNMENP
jgi:omega-6 fatty acid desaturase (delta-12 desaturase)